MPQQIDQKRLGRVLRGTVLTLWAVVAVLAMIVTAAVGGASAVNWGAAAAAVGAVVVVWVAAVRIKRMVRALLMLCGVILVGWSFGMPEVRVAMAVGLGGACVLVCLWAELRVMLAMVVVMLFAAIVMMFELTALSRPAELLEWGEPSTFAYLFPETPPLIGPGGRLRPNLDAGMVHPDKPNGVRIVTNSAGFRNRVELAEKKPADEIRVLNLGDSFSIGYRIDQDGFFGSVMQRTLNRGRRGGRVQVMNAEVSDPATGLHYLEEHGFGYEPDVVVYGLCGNDVMQAYSFVGPGRSFVIEGDRIQWRSPADEPRVDPRAGWDRIVYPHPCAHRPEWNDAEQARDGLLGRVERLELIRRLTGWRQRIDRRGQVTRSWLQADPAMGPRKRLIDGFPNLGFYYKHGTEIVDPMYETCFAVLGAMATQCRQRSVRLVLVIHPQRFSVQGQDWAAEVRAWSLRDEDFDLDLMSRRITQWCQRQSIACVDLTGPFRQVGRRRQLYLPAGDVHYNEVGHRLAGETVGRFVHAALAQRQESP